MGCWIRLDVGGGLVLIVLFYTHSGVSFVVVVLVCVVAYSWCKCGFVW